MSDFQPDEESNVCLNCIPDKHLRAALNGDAAVTHCKYCGKLSAGVSVDDLTKEMRDPLERCLAQGDYLGDHSGYPLGEQKGDSLDCILQDRFGFDDELAADIARLLIDNEVAELRGDEPLFVDGENYEWHVQHVQGESSSAWNDFEWRIKHTSRFFDSQCLMLLEQILGAAGSPEATELPVYLLDSEIAGSSVFRARRTESHDELREVCENTETQLAPHPPCLATAGRMNPRGIVVFYGALSPDVAVSEIRPSVGSAVVVGEFIPQKTFRLLDLPKLAASTKPLPDSIFAPNYFDLANRDAILDDFQSQITKPIQPHDQELDYVPTQAFAEYVGNVLGFDGILYASAQHNEESLSDRETGSNVVIFQDSLWIDQPFRPSLLLAADSVEVVRITAVNYHKVVEPFPDDDWYDRLREPV
ncbi:MAG: RES family NAD+ phosphorylase [Rhodopirellula sp.]|nr:RES family NAD+ phosphorylase [Rhodopirellula sp.]